jgi:hypothetical protein
VKVSNEYSYLYTHLLGREVRVQAGTVPVTGDGLRVYRDLGTELFGNAVKQVPGNPEMVTH